MDMADATSLVDDLTSTRVIGSAVVIALSVVLDFALAEGVDAPFADCVFSAGKVIGDTVTGNGESGDTFDGFDASV
ncbi:MAG: hypothetical protein WBS24_01865 [Terriglobales bacterium]